jgi:hypothetical protein
MLTKKLLVVVARFEADLVGTLSLSGRHGEHPNRSGTHDSDAPSVLCATHARTVPRDRCGLHQRTIGHIEPGRKVDEALVRGTELLTHAAVVEQSEYSLGSQGAEVVLAVETELADTTTVEPFNGHGRAVCSLSHELMAQYYLGAEVQVSEIGGADTHSTHREEFALTRWFIDVDEEGLTVTSPDGLHPGVC